MTTTETLGVENIADTAFSCVVHDGPGIDNALTMTVYTGSSIGTYYYLTDHLGTVHALASTNGAIVESYKYDAWGRVLGVYDGNGTPLTESAVGNRILWQGREYSWNTGLYYFRARWYDPVTGRWLSNDPIGISGGLNQYVFCGNNPVNWRDPTGLAPGQMPPAPTGSGDWQVGQWDNGRWVLHDPEGNSWTGHPEDSGHWRHWDRQGPNGEDLGRWPPNSKKVRPNQKKPKCDQSESDPSGNSPDWAPPGVSPLGPIMPVVPMDPMPIPAFPTVGPIFIRIPIPVFP